MTSKNIVNTRDIESLIKKDKIFLSVFDKYGSPPNWHRDQGFVSLARIILEQQVSLASAKAHYNKLKSYLSEITPKKLLSLSDKEFRFCQISRQKTEYLRSLSHAVNNKSLDLEKFSGMEREEITKALMRIKGIGQWTADIYLMFCMQYKDIFPSGDIAVLKSAKELSGIEEKEEIINMSENWKPLRSLAAYFFWHFYLSKRKK